MLSWANQFNIFSFLDNQQYSFQPHQYECLLAIGGPIQLSGNNPEIIDQYLSIHKTWLFGHLAYDLKNYLHKFASKSVNKINFPDWFFFKPVISLLIKDDKLFIHADDPETIFKEIQSFEIKRIRTDNIRLSQRYTKEEYISKIIKLKEHIKRGDCYEINFCQEFYCDDAEIDPILVYSRLMEVSPNPFSALYKLNDKYLICASPERFLTKVSDKLISQPMKGTIRRGETTSEDDLQRNELLNSKKDQAENIMVVDLVRNDLSKTCTSVKVEELNEVYSFPKVHQMISTVTGIVQKGTSFSEILHASFPMGSMTGAPKYRVMELIDQYEFGNRGLFSGSVGYIDEEGNFDFNVVIRSILYNQTNKYLSYFVGSGITFNSDPESEWEECLLKGEAIRNVLTSLSAT
jgi:Anthranilate/para-aminobenzoate synthases component I